MDRNRELPPGAYPVRCVAGKLYVASGPYGGTPVLVLCEDESDDVDLFTVQRIIVHENTEVLDEAAEPLRGG